MEKFKEFYDKNKKIVIPAAIILVLLIAVGVYFISQPNDNADKKAENQIEEKVNVSQDNKKEAAEQSKVNASEKPSDNKSVSSDKEENSGKSSSSPNKSGGKKSSGKQSKDNTVDNPSDDNTENHGDWSDNEEEENDYYDEQPAQTHTHHWKEHTVTEKVWVSKIVPVYETQSVQVGVNKVSDGWYWHCNCGAVIPTSQYEDHAVAHVEAGEMDNGYDEEHFHDEPIYEDQQVQVGTEDKGYYETETYVDYYYCDCGATK